MKSVLGAMLSIALLSTMVFAQWAENPMTGSSQQLLPDRTKMSGMSGMMPELAAGLVEPHHNAAEKKAVIRAEVWGIDLAQPQQNAPPNREQVYLSYVLDRNAPVMSTEKEYTFQNLSPGEHTITVQLMTADNHPLGAKVVMSVKVPK